MSISAESNFPAFKSIARLNSLDKNEPTTFFDVKFYPYCSPGVDPVFAVVGKAEAIICRPLKGSDGGIQVLSWFHDDEIIEKGESLNCCVWSIDLVSGHPLLCVAGQPPSIKILNIKTGRLLKSLQGHGKEVNDMAVSPLSPDIIASASMDLSVRIWSLDPKYEKQPCMAICGGEGHKEGLLTLAFHTSGRYLLTGGHDCVVNLWVIPDLPNEYTGTDKPTIIHYPHFSTSAIHTDFVDCVAWYHDLILSKCAEENKIVLWRIEGFDSSQAPPSPDSAPTTHEFRPTRSAFGGTYQRLLQFECADTSSFYMRFSLFTQPQQRPILAIGNTRSRIFLWDLQSLELWEGRDSDDDFKIPRAPQRGVAPRLGKQREGSVASETTTTTTHTGSSAGWSNTPASNAADDGRVDGRSVRGRDRYQVDDPFRVLGPHKTHVVQKITFASRQVAWSVGGEWMVVVGDQGMIALFGSLEGVYSSAACVRGDDLAVLTPVAFLRGDA